MALDNEDVKYLIQQLEADRQAYLSSHNKLQEVLIRVLANQAEGGPDTSTVSSTPGGSSTPTTYTARPDTAGLSNVTIHTSADSVAVKKPPSVASRKTAPSTLFETNRKKLTSVYSAEDSSDSDEGETFFAQNPLPTENFTEDQLRDHIRFHPWNDFSKLILGDLRRSGRLHLRESIFEPEGVLDVSDAGHTHADIYEVGEDGAPLKRSREDIKHGDGATWVVLRGTNVDNTRRQAVGRIIILREPTPLLFAALHLTMTKHFDMDSIYELLIDDTTSTKAYIKGHSMKDTRQQRSILFSFKYHTLVGKDRAPLHFQNHDPDVKDKDDHIPLSTCSSIVALSLSGPPLRSYRRHSRRSTTPETSHVHDPFAPWHVLSLQCFPDWHSEVNLHETHHHYVNGADAFLVTLLHEYRDATKRFRDLTYRIAKLATPLKEIIFNPSMRDTLLFETGDFVWSRRYFWASQTLNILSDEIDAMLTAYHTTFTDEVWSGEHKTLFPGPSDTSARYSNWRKKMAHQRKLFDAEMERLTEIRRFCDREQKDIKGLREWLFSGTSVQESRKAVEQASITVEQGYNIKLLTLVTIFFLPLTFVTSVFGMTNLPPTLTFLPFGITIVTICVPTYLLIGVINYRTFQKTVAYLAWPVVWTIANTKKSVEWAEQYRERYMRMTRSAGDGGNGGRGRERGWVRRAQTFASLQHRLTVEREADQVVQVRKGEHQAGGGGEDVAEVVDDEKRIVNDDATLPERPVPHRESTIKWDTLPTPPLSVEPIGLAKADDSSATSKPDLESCSTSETLRAGERVERPRPRPRSRPPRSPRRSLLTRLSARLRVEDPKSPV